MLNKLRTEIKQYELIIIVVVLLIYATVLLSFKINLAVVTSVIGIIGLFIAFYLNIEQQRINKKFDVYKELNLGLRAFIKEGSKDEIVKEMEEAYYSTWLYGSDQAYLKLLDYIAQYIKWVRCKNETRERKDLSESEKTNIIDSEKGILNGILAELEEIMRKEINSTTSLKGKDFKDYDFRPPK